MAPSKPLSFEGARADIDALKARNVDLSGLLPPLADTTSPGDDSLQRSYDFVASARAALRAAGTGEVDDAGTQVESVRDTLDGIIADLQNQSRS